MVGIWLWWAIMLASCTDATGRNFVWGVNGHPTQQATYSSLLSLEAQLDYLDQLGATHYRLDLSVDTFGVVDSFHSGRSVSFERVLDAASSRRLEILPVLTQRPDYRRPAAANYRTAYLIGLRFAEAYGARIRYIEAGNEIEDGALRYDVGIDPRTGAPDTNYWSGTAADHYLPRQLEIAIEFLRGMTRGIREGAPHIRIIVDVVGRHYGFFAALQKAGVGFDIYGLHWYSDMHQPGELTKVMEGLSRLDRNLPVWVTEANRRGGSESERPGDDQGSWITHLASEFVAYPQVRAFFVYELLDQPAFASSYGLVSCPHHDVDPNCLKGRTPKPAFYRYRGVIEQHRAANGSQRGR